MIQIDHDDDVPRPVNEARRQLAVERSGVLKRGGNSGLQTLVDKAATYYRAPIAAISIVDRDRQWFAVRTGLDVDETPRAFSFCAYAIHRPGEPLVVADARKDRRFARNPLVLFAPHIRFYAGVPLVDRMGYPLGAICIIDSKPRNETPNLFELSLLAREAERMIAR